MVGIADNVKTILCYLCCLLHNPKSMLKCCVLQPSDLGNQNPAPMIVYDYFCSLFVV